MQNRKTQFKIKNAQFKVWGQRLCEFLILNFALLAPLFAADAQSMPLPAVGTATGAPEIPPEDAALEEGKLLYDNGQYMAALGKFMTVLRRDPQQPEARRYLGLVIDMVRKTPRELRSQGSPGVPSGTTMLSNAQVDEELRKRLRKRSLLTMDLKAIPGVQVDLGSDVIQVAITTSLLFADKTGGLKEEGIPLLDRVSAWLETFGQQPVVIHCYPEETQDPASNGSLFLHRYAQLYGFFVDERRLPPARFISADMLNTEGPSAAPAPDKAPPRVVIEVQTPSTLALAGVPASLSMSPRDLQWLEISILSSKMLFNPEEGEWASFDLAALTRSGLRSWVFKILPAEKADHPVFEVEGTGNLLQRVSWGGRDQKTGSFVPSGLYTSRLVATNADGLIKTADCTLRVQRTHEEPPLAAKPKRKPHRRPVVAQKPTPKPPPAVAAAPAASKPAPVAQPAAPSPGPVVAQNPVASPVPGAAPAEATPLAEKQAPASSAPPVESAPNAEQPASLTPAESDGSAQAIWKQVVQFDPNDSELKPTVQASLERIAKTLDVYPSQNVRIVGFAATSEQNASVLARKRADRVRQLLIKEYQVDAQRVRVAGGKVTSESPTSGGSKVEISITN
jgi:outer membrane protein OmpA-like peptidoglycan-associated protein